MALVIVIAVAWLVILVPGFIRRRAASGETDSISHFHRQLRILEHSAPQPLVAPAYRLHGAEDGPGGATGWRATEPPQLTVVGARDLPRPALAFLAEETEAPRRGVPAAAGPGGLPSPRPQDAPRPPLDPEARRLARQRRRDTLSVLVLAFVASLMIGFVPGARLAWMAAAVLAVALAGYVALLANLRRLAQEREHKLRYLRPPATSPGRRVPADHRDDDMDDYRVAGAFAVR